MFYVSDETLIKEHEYLKGKRVNVGQFVYHKSSKANRKSILRNGIYPSVGDCYADYAQTEFGISDIDCDPAIFATNSEDENDWFDTTWDDDIWQIDTKIAGVDWFVDNHFYGMSYEGGKKYKHVVTFDNIPHRAVKLIKKGTGKSLY